MGPLAIPYPAIDPVAFWIGPLPVKWYGLAYVAGLLLGRLYIKGLLRQERLWRGGKAPFAAEQVDDLLLYMTVGVLAGGRLGYVLLYQPQIFVTDPLHILAVWQGGMSFHGALVATIAAMLLFARRVGTDAGSVMDACAAAVPVGLLLGRFANFVNGELWGRPSDVPWAMVFPGAGALPRHPSQLYEAALEGLVLFFALRALTHKWLALRRPGLVAGAFLVGYGLARSACELFRQPDPAHFLTFGPFTAGIVYSMPMIIGGIGLILWATRRGTAPADVGR
jgi:phosphatidylglycerol:prolipoprotein diacylglycerol transferase